MTQERITEAVAAGIYHNRAAFRQAHGLTARPWIDLNDASKDEYRSMARAAVAVIRGFAMVNERLPKLTLGERVGLGWRRFVRRYIVADEPEGTPRHW